MDNKSWPAWYYGPNNQAGIFGSSEEVPPGWVDHPSLVVPKKAVAPAYTTPAPAPTPATVTSTEESSNQGDAAGWAWSPEMHSATRTMTKAGLWRMKVGAVRPEPKEGFPKQVLDL